MKGGGGSTTTVQKSEPWAGQQDYLHDVMSNAKVFFRDPSMQPQYYPGQTIGDWSQDTLDAQGMTAARARNGSPITNQAKGYLSGVMNGDYLNSNPHLDQTYSRAADAVQGRVNAAFGGQGRFGSGLNQRALGDSLSVLANDVYGGNYQQERGRQQQGLLFAPQLANQDYYDIGQLANVGAQKDARGQDFINDNVERFNFNQQAPWNNLARYSQMVQGNYGGTSTSTSPYSQNRAAGMLGGALGGASLAGGLGLGSMSTLPWLSAFGPAGLAGGAVLGGLLGGM